MTREQQRQKLVGQKFGRLTVLRYSRSEPKQGPVYAVRCECGTEKEIRGSSLSNGITLSCGCLQVDFAKSGKARSKSGNGHGMTKTPIYRVWEGMIQRCTNPNSQPYERYGGRGIRVSEDWVVFDNFYRDMGDRPSRRHTLDRINNDGHYEAGNCRWATRLEQAQNTSLTLNLTHAGKTQCLSEWARELGITPATLCYRLKTWTQEEALNRKSRNSRRNRQGRRVV